MNMTIEVDVPTVTCARCKKEDLVIPLTLARTSKADEAAKIALARSGITDPVAQQILMGLTGRAQDLLLKAVGLAQETAWVVKQFDLPTGWGSFKFAKKNEDDAAERPLCANCTDAMQRYAAPSSPTKPFSAINLSEFDIDPKVINLISKEIAIKHRLLPVSLASLDHGSTLIVAMSNPSNILAIDDVKFLTGYNVEPVLASEATIKQAIEKYYGHGYSDHKYEPINDDVTKYVIQTIDSSIRKDERPSALAKTIIELSPKDAVLAYLERGIDPFIEDVKRLVTDSYLLSKGGRDYLSVLFAELKALL